jgi:hypothetical protein
MAFLTALLTPACRPLLGREVLDRSGQRLGTFFWLWHHDAAGKVQFFGVQTAWSSETVLVVPAEGVQVDQRPRAVRVPYPRTLVYQAPAYVCGAEFTLEQEREIYLHYDVRVTTFPTSAGERPLSRPACRVAAYEP